jgi:hypothetical protein
MGVSVSFFFMLTPATPPPPFPRIFSRIRVR